MISKKHTPSNSRPTKAVHPKVAIFDLTSARWGSAPVNHLKKYIKRLESEQWRIILIVNSSACKLDWINSFSSISTNPSANKRSSTLHQEASEPDLNFKIFKSSFRRELQYSAISGSDPLNINNKKLISKYRAEFEDTYYAALQCVEELCSEHPIPCANIIGFTWGGYFHESIAFKSALKSRNIDTFALEFSFAKGKTYLDPTGIIINRSVLTKIPDSIFYSTDQIKIDSIEKFAKNLDHGKYKVMSSEFTSKISSKNKNRTYILIACQTSFDSVISLDNPSYSTSIDTYMHLFTVLKKFKDVKVYVKLHPGDSDISKKIISAFTAASNFEIVEDNISFYDIAQFVDCGIVINSQSGLEMAMLGKRVLCLGNTFYSRLDAIVSSKGPKSLKNEISILLQQPSLTPAELGKVKEFMAFYLYEYLVDFDQITSLSNEISRRRKIYSPYMQEGSNCEFKLFAKPNNLLASKSENKDSSAIQRLMILHASGMEGGSGYYVQEIAEKLAKLGWNVSILCEATCERIKNGIYWKRIEFQNSQIDFDTFAFAKNLSPTHVLIVGIRNIPMIAGLQIASLFEANLFLQLEDDDKVALRDHYASGYNKTFFDVNFPAKKQLNDFLNSIDYQSYVNTISGPRSDRWIDPVIRKNAFQNAVGISSIWWDMHHKHVVPTQKPGFIMPPIDDLRAIQSLQASEDEVLALRKKYGLTNDVLIYFIAGNVYSFSDEYVVFLNALRSALETTGKKIYLVFAGRSRVKDSLNLARNILKGLAWVSSLKILNNEEYIKFSSIASYHVCPGKNDSFNELRFPGRTVKSIALKKPIISFSCGYAKDLKNNVHGFFAYDDSLEAWMKVLEQSLATTEEERNAMGQNLYTYFKNEVDSFEVVKRYSNYLIDPHRHGLD